MADTPIGGAAPGQRANLNIGQGAARLAPFGTPSAQPRPAARNQIIDPQAQQERLTLNRAPQQRIASNDPGPDFRGDQRQQQDYRGYQNGNNQPDDGPDILDDPNELQDGQDGGYDENQPVELNPDTVLFATDDGTPITVEEARRGYLRENDYRRKMQLVAQGRGVLEQHLGEVHAEREAVAGLIVQSLPDLSLPNVQRMGWDANTVATLHQQQTQMLQYVQQLKDRSAQERQRAEQAEIQQGYALLPEIMPDWIDQQTAQREQATTVKYLTSLGVPQNVQQQIGKNPWLVRLAVEAAKYQSVVMGGQRGRQAQQQQRRQQGFINPSLPATNQAPGRQQTRQQRDMDGLREQATRGRSVRDRMSAGVEMLRGVPVRQGGRRQ